LVFEAPQVTAKLGIAITEICMLHLVLALLGAAISSLPLSVWGAGLSLSEVPPGTTDVELKQRFAKAHCKTDVMTMGQQKVTMEFCFAEGTFVGRPAQYRISLTNGKVDGTGVIMASGGKTKALAQLAHSELERRFGSPTESRLKEVLKMDYPDFEEVAYWIERPYRSVYLRVCEPKPLRPSVLCPESRVIIDVTYKDVSQR
jgi:hypothetical protein